MSNLWVGSLSWRLQTPVAQGVAASLNSARSIVARRVDAAVIVASLTDASRDFGVERGRVVTRTLGAVGKASGSRLS